MGIDDWEHRNYKDSWLPSFDRQKLNLISQYKERNYQPSRENDEDKSKSLLPSMVSKIIDGTVKVMVFFLCMVFFTCYLYGCKPALGTGSDRRCVIIKGQSSKTSVSKNTGTGIKVVD